MSSSLSLLFGLFESCSREGAGIGEGLGMIVLWSIEVTAAVLLVATVSGVVVGRRKGNIARQLGLHLLCGVGLLCALPVLGGLWWVIYGTWVDARVARDNALYDAWLAPLRHMSPGGLDSALSAVMDAEGADAAGRRIYLIAALPQLLEPLTGPFSAREQQAARDVARRLREENIGRGLGSDPSNLDVLDGAVAWLSAKPALLPAVTACEGRDACESAVLLNADRWCATRIETCRAAFSLAMLGTVDAQIEGNTYAHGFVLGLRSRLAP